MGALSQLSFLLYNQSMKRFFPLLALAFGLSLLGEFGRYFWAFDLLSHWRADYVMAGLVLLAMSIWYKRREQFYYILIVISFHFFRLFPYLVLPLPINHIVQASEQMKTVSVVYMNSYWKNSHQDKVLDSVQKMDPDIIFFEEVRQPDFNGLRKELPEYTFSHHVQVASSYNIGVLSKFPLGNIQDIYYEDEVPTVQLIARIGEVDVTMVGTHPPSPMGGNATRLRNQHLERLFAGLNEQTGPIVVGGDFNLSQYSEEFQKIRNMSKLQDTMELVGNQNSWPTQLPKFLGIPIDQVFVSKDIVVYSRGIGPETGSDHRPVKVTLGIPQPMVQ